MTNYVQLLQAQIGDMQVRGLEQVLGPVYEIVGKIIDDHGPMFTWDIDRMLYDATRYWKLNPATFSSELAKCACLPGTGVSVITLGDAIEKVHGKCPNMKIIKSETCDERKVDPRMYLVYKTERSLIDYIKARTRTEEVKTTVVHFSHR